MKTLSAALLVIVRFLFVTSFVIILFAAEYCFILCIMIVFGDIGSILRVLPIVGPPKKMDYFLTGMLLPLNFGVSLAAYERILKLCAKSRSGLSVEIQTCTKRGMPAPVGDVITVELPRGFHRQYLTASVVNCAAAPGLILVCPEHLRTPFFWICVVAAPINSIYFLALWIRGIQQVRSDAKEIQGYPSPRSLRWNSASWVDIATCEILTRWDSAGNTTLVRPVFKDAYGATLMRLDLTGVAETDRNRLVKYIKVRLPEMPAGAPEL